MASSSLPATLQLMTRLQEDFARIWTQDDDQTDSSSLSTPDQDVVWVAGRNGIQAMSTDEFKHWR